MPDKNVSAETLQQLYQQLGIPIDHLESESGFTIHFLQETFKQLPYRSEPFRPNYFSFLFIKDAYGNYTIDDQRLNVSSLTVYFTNPGNYRIFEWEEIKDTCLITFNESYLKEYVHEDVYKDFSFLLSEVVLPRVLQPSQFKQIEVLYHQIYQEYKGKSLYRNKIIGSLMVVLLLKLKEYFFQDYNPIYEGNRSSQIVKVFKQNLKNHLRDLVNGKIEKLGRVQDFADAQSLQVNYFSSVISSKTGKSVSQWIADQLTTEAKVLLQNPQLTIKEIAGQLGFLEASHFSNYFKKNSGQSPVDYRKQHL